MNITIPSSWATWYDCVAQGVEHVLGVDAVPMGRLEDHRLFDIDVFCFG